MNIFPVLNSSRRREEADVLRKPVQPSASSRRRLQGFLISQSWSKMTTALAFALCFGLLATAQSQPLTFNTLAGQASGGSTDGLGANARFYNPAGAGLDSSGNLYVADTFNHTIRKITPGG